MTDSNSEKQVNKNKDGDEKKLTPEEEDKKEIYDAIKGLKPEEANDNIKSKLLMISDYHLDMKKIENDQHGKEYDVLMDKYDKQYQKVYDKIEEIVKSTEKIEISEEECTKYGITNEDSSPQEIKDYWEKNLKDRIFKRGGMRSLRDSMKTLKPKGIIIYSFIWHSDKIIQKLIN